MRLLSLAVLLLFMLPSAAHAGDPVAKIQTDAVTAGSSPVAHWGRDANVYAEWKSHTNRLIPIYTFGTADAGPGVSLASYAGENSVYRDADRLAALYGYLPDGTLNPAADYLDQTDIFRLQQAALKAGKKHIFLVVFDGMDWQSTQAAAAARSGDVYDSGPGSGLWFQDYRAGGSAEFGHMVTSPAADATIDVDAQTVTTKGRSGYDASLGGPYPWSTPNNVDYLAGRMAERPHLYADSAVSATAMTSGVKSYNGVINVVLRDGQPQQADTIAHLAQQAGYRVGAVSNVPISHATSAAAYAHNVSRNDYQDIARDLLGLPSIAHPDEPLPGLDVLIGAGFGIDFESDERQGANFVPGNRYVAAEDLRTLEQQDRYIMSLRTSGSDGDAAIAAAARQAADAGKRLFGFYGTEYKHLPYATTNGDYQPVSDANGKRETYEQADLDENPTLAQMTAAAITVLHANDRPFWLMVEAGDVDWAAHVNNLDNMIGAIYSGEEAVRVITDWVDTHSTWDESLLIVTADHGHYLVVTDPEALYDGGADQQSR